MNASALCLITGDEPLSMSESDSDAVYCSPSKRRRTESSSISSSSRANSSESSTVSTSCRTSSLTPASIIERSEPLSFFLTKVEGIESKFNQMQALDIRGEISLL